MTASIMSGSSVEQNPLSSSVSVAWQKPNSKRGLTPSSKVGKIFMPDQAVAKESPNEAVVLEVGPDVNLEEKQVGCRSPDGSEKPKLLPGMHLLCNPIDGYPVVLMREEGTDVANMSERRMHIIPKAAVFGILEF